MAASCVALGAGWELLLNKYFFKASVRSSACGVKDCWYCGICDCGCDLCAGETWFGFPLAALMRS